MYIFCGDTLYCWGKLAAENYSREFTFGPNPLSLALSPCPFSEGQGPLWRNYRGVEVGTRWLWAQSLSFVSQDKPLNRKPGTLWMLNESRVNKWLREWIALFYSFLPGKTFDSFFKALFAWLLLEISPQTLVVLYWSTRHSLHTSAMDEPASQRQSWVLPSLNVAWCLGIGC